MRRLSLLPVLLVITALTFSARMQAQAANSNPSNGASSFHLVETNIFDLQQAYRTGLVTPEQVINMYHARIATYDGLNETQNLHNCITPCGPLSSYMFLNPHAVDQARALISGPGRSGIAKPNQPLWGVPMILKDNINTADMPTTAGSVALAGSVPPADAFITQKLRAAGAIILGKGTLTEFANFLTNGMPTGFSSQLRQQQVNEGGNIATVGYGFNPYDPRPDPRTGFNDGRPALATGGSSSGPGIAVASNFAEVGIGTETSGSILSPSFQNMLVGIKPTIGLVSRTGIVPITEQQDTAGPIARSVADAAKVLGVIAGYDPQDPATAACLTPGKCLSDYTQFLNKDALAGARIAVPYYSYWTTGSGKESISAERAQVMEDAVSVLRSLGATVVDCNQFYAAEYGANGYQNGGVAFNCPGEIPNQSEVNNFGICAGPKPFPTTCSTVLLYGFKHDLNNYLSALGPSAPVHNLQDIIDVNNADSAVALKYGQILALAAQSIDDSPGSTDTQRYLADRAMDIQTARTDSLDMEYQNFDAVLFPANFGAGIAAKAGFPSITVPGGFYVNPPVPLSPLLSPPLAFPTGFDAQPAPFGVTFSGPAFSEGRLIGYAYAFEQATHHRVPPPSVPPLATDVVGR